MYPSHFATMMLRYAECLPRLKAERWIYDASGSGAWMAG
jgi:hypothetical protein